MSFALSAIIIIIILLPGAAVLRAYYNSIKAKQGSIHVPLNELLFRGLLFSFLIHSSALCTLRYFSVYPDLSILYNIILGKDLDLTNQEFISIIVEFSSYNIFVLLISWVLAKIFKNTIQRLNIDINFHSFRVTNYWFHLFSARYLRGKKIQGDFEKTDIVFLDILLNNGYIYSGFLLDFNYSPQKDELENIVLTNTIKRKFEGAYLNSVSSTPNVGKTTVIPGDVFVISPKDAININITYFKFNRHKTAPVQTPPVKPF